MSRRPHLLVGIGHEDPPAQQGPPSIALPQLRVGGTGGHFFAHLLDHLLDVTRITKDPLQPFDHVGIVADIFLHHANGIVEDVVDGKGYRTVDRLDALGCGRRVLGHEQFERVESRRHVSGKDLEKLKVGFREPPRLRCLNIEGADHLVMHQQGHGH